ncbi:MAG: putative bacterial non-heme ferritin [uncultured marine phage]|uniref:Putative bacterial non-heme ferritin n=1 Tax=uncultured marine phage TaxID=707152 RepID=A0A8D9C9X5_9VIRU|nr:MAG: putative bacterial non-heme ferritin [uncultured marine phage]
MIKDNIIESLNNQIKVEYDASNYYLALAIYFETKGFKGISEFFYNQSTEERDHMLMVIRYMTEMSAEVQMPDLTKYEVPKELDVKQAFMESLENEMGVTNCVNESHHISVQNKDYTTANFLQWFINEQRGEEDKFRSIIDKLNIIGDSGVGLYQIDGELGGQSTNATE